MTLSPIVCDLSLSELSQSDFDEIMSGMVPDQLGPTMDQPTTPDKYPTTEMFDETFTVKVGKGKALQTYTLYKGVTSFYSGYFAAALKKNTFIEGRENCVTLKDEDPELFRDFVGWIYTRQFRSRAKFKFGPLVRMWIMSDRYMVPLLGNEVINFIKNKAVEENVFPNAELHFVYRNTLEASGLRRLIIVLCVFGMGKSVERYNEDKKNWTGDPVFDAFAAFVKYRKLIDDEKAFTKRVATLDICEFHVHNPGEKCPGTKK